VISNERLHACRGTELDVTVKGVGELPEVAILERAPNALPQFVLGDRVKVAICDEGGVIAVDDLTKEYGAWETFVHAVNHGGPEGIGHRVCDVEAPTRDATLKPVLHDADGEIECCGVGVIEFGEVKVTFPVLWVSVVGHEDR